jgi:hypothetical protein
LFDHAIPCLFFGELSLCWFLVASRNGALLSLPPVPAFFFYRDWRLDEKWHFPSIFTLAITPMRNNA